MNIEDLCNKLDMIDQSLKKENNSLKEENSLLNQRINTLLGDIHDLKEKIKELEEAKTASRREIGNMKTKLTISKKKTKKMEEVYENDEVESAEDFLRKFAKSK